MKNIKIYIIAGLIIIFLVLVIAVNVQKKRIDHLKSETERLRNNQDQLTDDNAKLTVLNLRSNEIQGKVLSERDSLLKVLKLRPKEILKIEHNIIIQHDTIKVPVPAEQRARDYWFVSDTGKCFLWQADINLFGDSLAVDRTNFQYQNKITNTYYKKRPKKFLFIHYGKWNYRNEINATCGESKTEIINFIK